MACKLIVSDLDGCLLHSDGSLPARFGEAFGLMQEKDVVFAAASGRSLAGMAKPFEAYADKMTFIADNGARVCHRGRSIFLHALQYDDYYTLIEELRRHENLVAVACGVHEAWIENSCRITPAIEKELKKYYPSWKTCEFDSIPDQIIKFALLYFDDIEKNIYPFFQRFDNDRLCVQVTAFVWIDVFKKGISKGMGVKALQKELGIAPEETLVFGDYLNDISMADFAARSFAPANAHPKVKERFTDIIGESDGESVAETTIKMLAP